MPDLPAKFDPGSISRVRIPCPQCGEQRDGGRVLRDILATDKVLLVCDRPGCPWKLLASRDPSQASGWSYHDLMGGTPRQFSQVSPVTLRRVYAPSDTCAVCGGSVRSGNQYGVCSATSRCRRERNRRAYEQRYALAVAHRNGHRVA